MRIGISEAKGRPTELPPEELQEEGGRPTGKQRPSREHMEWQAGGTKAAGKGPTIRKEEGQAKG